MTERYGYIYTDKYKWEDKQKQLNASPTPSAAAAALVKHEPEVLQKFVSLVESMNPESIKPLVALFTPDATADSGGSGPKSPEEFYRGLLPKLKGLKMVNKHKLIDPSQPNTAALYFAVSGEVDGKFFQFQVVDMLELNEAGTKIKKLVGFLAGEGPKAKL